MLYEVITIQGIRPGTFVAVYSQKDNSPDAKPLAHAEVTERVGDFSAEAVLQKDGGKVSAGDRVVIVTPGFSSARMRVVLDTHSETAAGKKVIVSVDRLLKNYSA